MNADKDMLRQQAGRVDVPRRKASDYADGTYGPEDLAAIWNVCCEQHKKAALAQNTQGEAVACIHPDTLALLMTGSYQDTRRIAVHRPGQLCGADGHIPLYLHAERARVPELDAEDWKVLERLRNALPDVGLNGWLSGVRVLEKLLSAAPPQRAEVK